MGLLDGLKTLQGAPAPLYQPANTKSSTNGSDMPLNNISTSARLAFDGLQTTVSGFGDAAKTSATNIRRFLGDESVDVDLEAPPTAPSISEELASTFNLSLFQRVALFAMIFGTGIVLLILSFSFLTLIVIVPHKFAASFTMGNILAITSTWVLVGPKAQIQSMFQPVRAAAAAAYVVSLLVALIAAFFGGKFRYFVVLPAIVVEILACKLCVYIESFCNLVNQYDLYTNIMFYTFFHFLFSSGLVCFKLHPIWSTYAESITSDVRIISVDIKGSLFQVINLCAFHCMLLMYTSSE